MMLFLVTIWCCLPACNTKALYFFVGQYTLSVVSELQPRVITQPTQHYGPSHVYQTPFIPMTLWYDKH